MKNWGLTLVVVLTFAGCSFSKYLLDQGSELARIKKNRIPITHAILHPEYRKHKSYFDLIPRVKDFAVNVLGYPPTHSYNTFLPSSDQGHWILSAVRSDVLVPKIWHFPIMGNMPYIGYFQKEGMEREQRSLQENGFDTYVRMSAAFSGLGYFEMPVVETMMQQDEIAFIETLLHEMTHEAYYVFGATQFNEGLAQFMAEGATHVFIQSIPHLRLQSSQYKNAIASSRRRRNVILQAWASLLELLGTDLTKQPPTDWKAQKAAIFNELDRRLHREQDPLMPYSSPKPWNNARIYAETVYLADHCYFEALYRDKKFKDLKSFLDWVKSHIPKENPSQRLRESVGTSKQCPT